MEQWASIILTAGLVAATTVLARYTKLMSEQQKAGSEAAKQQADGTAALADVIQQSATRIQKAREAEQDVLRRILVLELRKNYMAVTHTGPGQRRQLESQVWQHLRFTPVTDPETWSRLAYLYDVLLPEASAHPSADEQYHIPSGQVGQGCIPAQGIRNTLVAGNDGLLSIFQDRYGIQDARKDVR